MRPPFMPRECEDPTTLDDRGWWRCYLWAVGFAVALMAAICMAILLPTGCVLAGPGAFQPGVAPADSVPCAVGGIGGGRADTTVQPSTPACTDTLHLGE